MRVVLAEFKEFGMGYTQGSWLPGKLERAVFGDEKDDSIEFDPASGGHNLQLYHDDVARIQTTLMALPKVTGFYSAIGTGFSFPPALIFKKTTKGIQNKFIPVCQLLSGTDLASAAPCDCIHRGADGEPVARNDLRLMSWAIVHKADAAFNAVGRKLSNQLDARDGVVV